jgi:hypothetical protein
MSRFDGSVDADAHSDLDEPKVLRNGDDENSVEAR